MTKKEYLKDRAKYWGITQKLYYEHSKVNYVILEGGNEPLCWENGLPVVYGGKEDAEPDMYEGDKLITEKEWIDSL